MGEVLIWVGGAMALTGCAGAIWCFLRAMDLRRAARRGEDPTAGLRPLVARNTASMAVAFFGFGVMIVGIVL